MSVEEHRHAVASAQRKMVLAFRADVEIGFEVLLPDDRAAAFAFRPEAFGADAALVWRDRILDRFLLPFEPGHALIVYPALGENAFRVWMLHLAHFGYEVGKLDDFRMRVAAGADYVEALRTPRKFRGHLFRIEHLVADHVVDLVEDHEIPLAAVHLLDRPTPGFLAQSNVFGIGLRAADFHE